MEGIYISPKSISSYIINDTDFTDSHVAHQPIAAAVVIAGTEVVLHVV